MKKQALINYIKKPKEDEFYTPKEAILPLLKYIPKYRIIWECTDTGDSKISYLLKEMGHKVISTHIKTGFDFLKDNPNFNFDIIITNPPYSQKTEFLKRAYELNKPFGLLMPITTLEGKKRGELYRNYGIQLLIFDKRINFSKTKKRPWFGVAWFCYKLLPSQLIFMKI